jgi:hypothetical protein
VRQRILVVGMLDSIHTARWLACFRTCSLDFFLFPSRRLRSYRPELLDLIRDRRSNATYQLAPRLPSSLLNRHSKWLEDRIREPAIGPSPQRVRDLQACISDVQPDIIHALEIQGGGYLAAETLTPIHDSLPLLISNWGSDISYFGQLEQHHPWIAATLGRATSYGGECFRDINLALSWGFEGRIMPVVPNSGWIPDVAFEMGAQSAPSQRRLCVVKGYQSWSGRALLALEAINPLLEDHPHLRVLVLAPSAPVGRYLSQLRKSTRSRYMVPQKNRLAHVDVLKFLSSARLYLGASNSDGISTMALEAAACGAAVVQSESSCLADWVPPSKSIHIVPLDVEAFREAIEMILLMRDEVDRDATRVQRTLSETISHQGLQDTLSTYYQQVC